MNVERPISAVLTDIAGNVQTIVRSEMRLAKTELAEDAKKAGSAGMMIGAGILMLALSGGFALLAVVYALSTVMPNWAAALVVAAFEGLMAALFVGLGIKRFKAMRGVPRTRATIKENAEWARQLTR